MSARNNRPITSTLMFDGRLNAAGGRRSHHDHYPRWTSRRIREDYLLSTGLGKQLCAIALGDISWLECGLG